MGLGVVYQVGHPLSMLPVVWVQSICETRPTTHDATPRERHEALQKNNSVFSLIAQICVPHGQNGPSIMGVGIEPNSRWCFVIRLPLQAQEVHTATSRVAYFMTDTGTAVQQDDYVTNRFRNALSGVHLDFRMRDLGAYSTVARAFDFLVSKIGVGRYYGTHVQPVPPSTLATTFKELQETPESDGALLIQYVTSALPPLHF